MTFWKKNPSPVLVCQGKNEGSSKSMSQVGLWGSTTSEQLGMVQRNHVCQISFFLDPFLEKLLQFSIM